MHPLEVDYIIMHPSEHKALKKKYLILDKVLDVEIGVLDLGFGHKIPITNLL